MDTEFSEGMDPVGLPALIGCRRRDITVKLSTKTNAKSFGRMPQWIGLKSGGFEYMRLARDIERMISNYQRIIDGYISSAPREKLAAATQTLCGNFEGGIVAHDF